MKALPIVIGVAAGLTIASAALMSMYPDVPRRMARDSKKAVRCTRRAVMKAFT